LGEGVDIVRLRILGLLVMAAIACVAAPALASAQQPAKVWRIGFLDNATSDPASVARWKAFRERLRELGYMEGQNVIFESRSGDGQVGRLRGLAGDLIGAKVDILVTAGSEAARAAKRATSTIPIVTATGGDLVELGLAASLAQPGGNVTGVISLIGQLTGKRLELLKQLMPRASRVAVLRNPDNRSSGLTLRDAERAAKSLGMVVRDVVVRGPRDLDAAFLAVKRARVDAVILGGNTEFIADRRRLADLAVTHRLPLMVPAKEYAEAGALISYGTDYLDLFRRAATFVDKILKGAKPGDLPIEQPTKFELVINLKTAKALGLALPQSLVQRADEVIQ
jgi:putative tryptophan/tyrosine transport system substrate-binding protein